MNSLTSLLSDGILLLASCLSCELVRSLLDFRLCECLGTGLTVLLCVQCAVEFSL